MANAVVELIGCGWSSQTFFLPLHMIREGFSLQFYPVCYIL